MFSSGPGPTQGVNPDDRNLRFTTGGVNPFLTTLGMLANLFVLAELGSYADTVELDSVLTTPEDDDQNGE